MSAESSKPDTKTTLVHLLCLGGIFLLVFSFGIGELADPDIWWNTAAGLHILQQGQLPPAEFFGFHGCGEGHQIFTTWPAQATIAFFYQQMELWGLNLLRGMILLLIALIIWLRSPHKDSPFIVLLVIGMVLGGLSLRASVRPELFSWLCFVIQIHLLWSVARSPTPMKPWDNRLLGILAIQSVWAYLHSAFPLSFVVGAFLFAGELLQENRKQTFRRGGLALVALVIGTSLQPHGFAGFIHPFVERGLATGAYGFREWQSTWNLIVTGRTSFPWTYVLALVLFWLLIPLILRSLKAAGGIWMAAIPLLVLGWDGIRHWPYFILLAPFWFFHAWPEIKKHPAAQDILSLATLTLALFIGIGALKHQEDNPIWDAFKYPNAPIPSRLAPIGASNFLNEKEIKAKVFAPLHFSNIMLLRNSPHIEVLWSGRRTYSGECHQQFSRGRFEPEKEFVNLHNQYHFDLILVDLHREGALVTQLIKLDWPLVYADLRHALFAAPESLNALKLKPLQFDSLKPSWVLARETRPPSLEMASTLLSHSCFRLARMNAFEIAIEHCLAAREKTPKAPEPVINLVQLYVFLQDGPAARALLAKATAQGISHPFLKKLEEEVKRLPKNKMPTPNAKPSLVKTSPDGGPSQPSKLDAGMPQP